ncbi:hypothetical protein [Streptomyces wuyuanensis]|uniref:hypothetical protein n=1 Tax=Streptomyces wuyuanensis TaxID=1196353 RepID=UPI0037237EBD
MLLAVVLRPGGLVGFQGSGGKAAAAEREAEARRRACARRQEDRGTAGRPREKCKRLVAPAERDTAPAPPGRLWGTTWLR